MLKNGVRTLSALRQIAVNLEPCRNLKKISKLAKQYDAQKNEIHWSVKNGFMQGDYGKTEPSSRLMARPLRLMNRDL